MKIAERIFLTGISLFAIIMDKECEKLPISSEYTIGPGFLPKLISYGIILVSLIMLVQSFTKSDRGNEYKAFISKTGFIRLLYFFAVFLVAVISVGFVGMLIPLGVFMIIVFKFIEKYNWFSSIKVSVLSLIIFYVIFKVWLGVPIPVLGF